ILYQEDDNIGVMVSEVTEIPTISEEDLEAPSEALESPVNRKYLEGIVKHEDKLVLLTDLLGVVENISEEDVKQAEESGKKSME
ncbi:MAG: chemotaxis protein CheW, partial [Candidatus Thermoplasmatota archaeon]